MFFNGGESGTRAPKGYSQPRSRATWVHIKSSTFRQSIWFSIWRREWDSNPRSRYKRLTRFRVVRFQPDSAISPFLFKYSQPYVRTHLKIYLLLLSKNSFSICPLSSASTPDFTITRWLNAGWSRRSTTEPAAPARGS